MLWVAAALLGIAATATVAWSASRLAATSVGLAGAPLSVTSGLAPARSATTRTPTSSHAAPKRHAKPHPPVRPAPPQTSPPASSTASPLPVTPTTATSVPAPTPAPHKTRPRDDSNGSRSGDSHRGRDD